MTAHYRRLRKLLAGWVLVGLGVDLSVFHVVTHLGSFQVLPSAEWQELLLGYPMAGVLMVAGIILLSSRTPAGGGRISPGP